MNGKKGYLNYSPDKFHPIPQFISIGDEGYIMNNRFYAGQVVDLIEKSTDPSPPMPISTPALDIVSKIDVDYDEAKDI